MSICKNIKKQPDMTLAQSEATSGTQLSKASMADGGPSTNTGKARVAVETHE